MNDGGYVFATPGTYTPIDIRDDSSLLPMPGEDIYSHFIKIKGGTRISWVALTEALWNKNLLYFSFPKKAKRKLRKYARIRKRMFPRKKYDVSIPVLFPEIFDKNDRKYLINSRVIPFDGPMKPGIIKLKEEENGQ